MPLDRSAFARKLKWIVEKGERRMENGERRWEKEVEIETEYKRGERDFNNSDIHGLR